MFTIIKNGSWTVGL